MFGTNALAELSKRKLDRAIPIVDARKMVEHLQEGPNQG